MSAAEPIDPKHKPVEEQKYKGLILRSYIQSTDGVLDTRDESPRSYELIYNGQILRRFIRLDHGLNARNLAFGCYDGAYHMLTFLEENRIHNPFL